MNQGKFVFSQVIEFIPRYQFDKLVKQYKGDWHVKNLTSYNHFLHLFFGQLTGCDSLRDICLCLEAHSKMLYHLGFRNTVNHTSLSRANESRDYRIFEGLGVYLIGLVRPMYSKVQLSEITIDNVIYALDSTTISTSIKLAAWALGSIARELLKCTLCLICEGVYLPISILQTENGMTATNSTCSRLSHSHFMQWTRRMLTSRHCTDSISRRLFGCRAQRRT